MPSRPTLSRSKRIPDMTGVLVDHRRLKLLEELGSGAYGKVYRALDVSTANEKKPKYYAVKVLLKPKPGSQQEDFQLREVGLHELVSGHRNIITLHQVLRDKHYVYVVLDLCTGGDLFAATVDNGLYRNNEKLIRRVFIQLVDAVQYCHDKGVYHRDIKPENILCTRNGGRVYLADFGLSTHEETSQGFGCGSSYYMSPETIGEEHQYSCYSTRDGDVWALGVILVNLTTGRNPWKKAVSHDSCYSSFLQDQDFLRTVLPISAGLNKILKGVFNPNQTFRTTLPQLRQAVVELDTFYMSRADLDTASEHVKEAAMSYGIWPTKRAMVRKFSRAESQESTGSEGVAEQDAVQPKEVAEVADTRLKADFNKTVDASNGSGLLSIPGSGSSTSDESSGGPITPQSRPADPAISVANLSEEGMVERLSPYSATNVAAIAGLRKQTHTRDAPLPSSKHTEVFRRAVRRIMAFSSGFKAA